MSECEGANRTSKKFIEFWDAQRSLCNIQIERRKTLHTLTEQDDKIFTEKELQEEGEEILNEMTDAELETMVKEIRENLAADSSFASELQFWQNLSQKVRQRIAINKIERLYDQFVDKNRDNITRKIG